jgi:hypothetical protein
MVFSSFFSSFHVDVDVFLLDARNLGAHRVGLVAFLHVELDLQSLGVGKARGFTKKPRVNSLNRSSIGL